jgi:hypothetical protein
MLYKKGKVREQKRVPENKNKANENRYKISVED